MAPRADDDSGSVPIHLRLDRAVWDRYSSEAARLSKPLSTYLRERLEREDELLAELASIRRAVENLAGAEPNSSGNGSASPGMLLEVLLLCRALAQHQRTESAQAEVRRLGMQVWQGDPPSGRGHAGR